MEDAMGYRYLRDNGVLEPLDLALVLKVFRKLSAERGFAAESTESEELAIRCTAPLWRI
jgi:hypothetical protein